ncbi:MAG: MBL fold metallo-hydrolase [Jannaschia helgolandensis]|uniref:Glyoxylase, beta-lactamase superfamily II n=1 Tax=Jannaschia helgolandensis TaxID=188906 RepID=A0A1H7MJ72_9RHOB|nr:MBL fold metallo-hydrolase [Jannaschia helgolandensis]SEL11346.1 Glyoxylase, beta-lactamase superfamily II [Jannaschia helgolandensis]
MTLMTRRAALGAGAALPIAAVLPAQAAAPMQEPTVQNARRFMLGDLEVTTLLANTLTNPTPPQEIFGMNVDAETFAAVSAEAFIPADVNQFFFTPTLVNNGESLILFDTGQSPEDITAAVEGAGYATGDIDTVVLTHMHGDHIGGLMANGTPTFANAAYVTGQTEFDAWAAMENEGFETKVRPLSEKMTFIGDGQDAAPGITAIAAFGHTPGHMSYRLSSGDKSLLIAADLANHYVWSLAYPDWEVKFDMDKEAAANSRRTILGMLASERMPMIGYHMPFPAVGYVETRGDGFRWVPESYQMML